MSSRILISALAVVATIAVVAARQDPSFEFPALKHAGFNLPKIDLTEPQTASDKVSVTFRNATIREVLDWLKSQGVSFIVGDDQVDKDARVSVHIVNEPVDAVMNAIGSMLGGHWDKKNDIWVFQKGRDIFGTALKYSADDSNITLTPAKPDTNVQVLGDVMSGEQDETLEKALQNGNDSKAWEDFIRAWEKWAGEYEKNFQDFQKNLKGKQFEYKVDQRQMEALRKQAEELAKQGQRFRVDGNGKVNGFIWEGKDMKPFDQKQIEQLRKQAEDMAKSGVKVWTVPNGDMKGFTWDGKDMKPFDQKQIEQLRKQAEEMAKSGVKVWTVPNGDMKGFTWDGKDMKQLDQKQLEEMQKRTRELLQRSLELQKKADDMKAYTFDGAKVRMLDEKEMKALEQRMRDMNRSFRVKRFGNGPEVNVSTSDHNLKAIYDLLTPEQNLKLKRLGYINYSDLNSKQRALLGVITDESWTITYKTDKANLTIKSDR
ncbi:MAG TPA: hypothetical protein VHE55_01590 [Fimbriimonadaceae bacterium]|nr:hypothetical protein [Fimbriimonadaceae bacterium]